MRSGRAAGEGGCALGNTFTFRCDEHGFITPARQIRSPNYDERPSGAPIDLLVIHNISLPAGVFGGRDIERLFTNTLDPSAHPDYPAIAGLRVSAHLLVRRDGEVVQFVPLERRAWHAGVSAWKGRSRCNDFSIGIELEGTDAIAFEPVQYACLAGLTRTIRARYPIRDVVGHSHIAPGRKTDPGPAFDWSLYAALA